MAKKKEEEVMYPYAYPPMMYPPGGGGEDPLIQYQRYADFFSKMAKDAEEKKKNDTKKKPEPRKFTFLETFGMTVMFGPVIGFTYLYAVKYTLIQVEQWFK